MWAVVILIALTIVVVMVSLLSPEAWLQRDQPVESAEKVEDSSRHKDASNVER